MFLFLQSVSKSREISRLVLKMQSSRWNDIANIQHQLGDEISEAFPGFHAISGCDITSGFSDKGKTTFFKLLKTNAKFQNCMKSLGESLNWTHNWFPNVKKLYVIFMAINALMRTKNC